MALARPSLEYACIVRSPNYEAYIDEIESIQRKYLRIISYKLNITDIHGKYNLIAVSENITTLLSRRNQADLA